MKKVITIIICLLCALTASAVSYAKPYKGAGKGYIYTTLHNSQSHSSIGSSTILAQAPVAAISSVNSSRGISTTSVSVTRVQSGICTSASSISGGVTTYDTGHHHPGRIRKDGSPEHHGEPGTPCPHCVDEDGDGICDICDEELEECTCDPCRCPITDGWQVWAFMAILAAAYALCKKRMAII